MDLFNSIRKSAHLHCFTQYIIVDIGIPTPAHFTDNIIKTIQNVVSLGQNGVSVLGVALINETFQQVLSLSNAQTQLPKILRSLKTVVDMKKCRARVSLEEFLDIIHVGTKKAIEDFQSFASKMEENEHHPSELQIMILTMKNVFDQQKRVEDLAHLFQSSPGINKIQVVELSEHFLDGVYNKSSSNSSSLVEFIKMPGTTENLEKLFKQRFTNYINHKEHVRVLLKDCTILCDIRECLISPDLPVASSHDDPSLETEVPQLEITQRLSSDGLCETQLYGIPIALVPTQCKGMDRSSKQLNHQHFTCLNGKIMASDEYLVAKCETKGQPLSYFVLMPGEGLMLLKSLVPAEMALSSIEAQNVQVTQEVNSRITDTLMLLPTLDVYRPADFSTGLYRHLIASTTNPQKEELLCKDPSHKSSIVGVNIKKTTKGKVLESRKRRKTSNNLPTLSDSDQQKIKQLLARKKLFKC